MEGIIAPCQLTASSEVRTGGIRFEVATRAHDAAIRQLLRETPMQGAISLSMQREPSHFAAAAIEGGEHRTLIALEDERVVAAGSVSVRQRFINGQPARVGYLSGLRLAWSCRGRASVIRRGYELLHQMHQDEGGPAIYLTSILADNLAARKLLERGLEGMPTYRFLGEFVTLVVRRHKPRRASRQIGLELVRGDDSRAEALLELLNNHNRHHQFAPVYCRSDLELVDLSDFRLACTSAGAPVACAALWDQRSFKQTVVAGYSPQIHCMRPLINIFSAITGRPRLPATGEAVSSAFISHLAAPPQRSDLIECLIDLLHGAAHERNIDYVVLGLDARDPRLPALRRSFRRREYVSRLYAVHWEDGSTFAANLDDRLLLAPEVALL